MSEECKRCHESFDVPYPFEPPVSGLCGSCADAVVVELEAENKKLLSDNKLMFFRLKEEPRKGELYLAAKHLYMAGGDISKLEAENKRFHIALRKVANVLGPKVDQYPIEDSRCGLACEAQIALETAQKALEGKSDE